MSFRAVPGLPRMAPTAIRFDVPGAVLRADVPGLCAGLAESLRGRNGGVVVCDVTRTRPDLAAVDLLARLCLTARRHGWSLVLHGAGPPLRHLLGLTGLGEVLAEPGRQAEEREQPGGVQEVVHRGDPPG
ncbi:STAS domain-containing protein [Jidongwangia harbinensis]|uniref:STAS domain-containing protein n=1 Tax=Jidongwangia harbinensis TaxID=2878561 RepID=UPI001CD9F417|nr:STAS domain-containing protein [Jidongwangia harbinensis]MCA2217718.1 STAS domain-containing protein [Jidongwangia harbinensis]